MPLPRPRSEHKGLVALRQRVTFSWMFDEHKPEGMDVFYDFLERGCRLDPDAASDPDAFYDTYQVWCGLHRVQPVSHPQIADALEGLGVRFEERIGARQVWSGLAVTLTLPFIPEADDSPEGRAYEAAVISTFIGDQLRSAPWSNASEDAVYACYRAWCRRRELRPAPRERLAEQLARLPWLEEAPDAEGRRVWKGAHCKGELN